jgi:hypothetical protein
VHAALYGQIGGWAFAVLSAIFLVLVFSQGASCDDAFGECDFMPLRY